MRSIIKHLRIAASFGLIATAPAAMALASAPQSGQAAIVFDPMLERREMAIKVARAGAELVRFGGAPGVVVVNLPEDGPAALRRAGAWLVLDPVVLGGCATPSDLTNS